MRRLASLLLTVGGIGHSRLGPGSLGALPAIALAGAMREAHWSTWIAVCWFLSVVGISFSDFYLLELDRCKESHALHPRTRAAHDPQEIVLDEFIGCLIALAFVPWSWPWVLAAYLLFRLLDMLKPGPIGWLERNAPNGIGIIGDDVLAGLLAGLLLLGLGHACQEF